MEFPEKWSEMNVALSHDWLVGMRGGERVFEILCKGFPDADIYTILHNPSAVSEVINQHNVNTSYLQNWPGVTKYYRNLLPFFSSAIEKMREPDADLIISTSHCVAKGLRAKPDAKHLCYCFTPVRYAWMFFDEYLGRNPVKGMLAKPFLEKLRNWDRQASDRVDRFVAISDHIRKRIKKFYDRDADIVYPPVDTERWTIGDGKGEPGDFDLIVSALVPYKKVDLAVKAYTRLGARLKIVGTGSETSNLKALAGSNVEFLGWRSDEEILEIYRTCRMLVFPGEEDFGIVPLEVQACGRPVVAYGKGGALETVSDGVSGVFFKQQTEESLLSAVEECESRKWDAQAIRANTDKFGIQNFIDGLAQSIEKCQKEK